MCLHYLKGKMYTVRIRYTVTEEMKGKCNRKHRKFIHDLIQVRVIMKKLESAFGYGRVLFLIECLVLCGDLQVWKMD